MADLITTNPGRLCPDGERTVLRPFHIGDPGAKGDPGGRERAIIDRIVSLDDRDLERELRSTVGELKRRHDGVDGMLDLRFAQINARFDGGLDGLGRQRRRMIAAFFTEEFSVEAAAVFNPSVVVHPDQTDAAAGETRVLMSLRGIGEGHVSSLLFQEGTWRADGSVDFDPRGPRATGPDVDLPSEDGAKRTAELRFPDVPVGQRVVYPFLPSQGRGIEDARFCLFTEDDGSSLYRGTFTAFDGMQARQAVVATTDFRTLTARRLDGDLAFHKGAAWFPRRLRGRYAMLGRVDEESICLLLSDDPDRWCDGAPIIRPRYPWEFVQMGNCGSPIEIDEGWLVLTHGVGRARRYCIGAALLDRDDPGRVLARTAKPILEPGEDDRGGYVPNVVYSCGGMVRGRELLLPYAIADNYAAVGTVGLDDLLAAMD